MSILTVILLEMGEEEEGNVSRMIDVYYHFTYATSVSL